MKIKSLRKVYTVVEVFVFQRNYVNYLIRTSPKYKDYLLLDFNNH